jgi:hypothetical protein
MVTVGAIVQDKVELPELLVKLVILYTLAVVAVVE